MELVYSRQAIRDLGSIDTNEAKKIQEYMELYAENPSALPPKRIKKLVGNLQGCHRLRVGDYRAVFTDNEGIVTVVKIRHRREIYD